MSRLFFLVVLLFLGAGVVCQAGVEQVLVVLWHGLDWPQAAAFDFEAPQAWGLLNTRAGGGQALAGAYLSLGCGARAVGPAGAPSFVSGDPQGLYSLHTGLPPSPIVQPQIALIHQAQQVSYKVLPGALGTALKEAGLPAAALGNSDGGEIARWAPLIVMDVQGRVFQGEIGPGLLLEDPSYPFAVHTDYALLKKEVLARSEALVVVDLGDPYRYDQYQDLLLPQQKKALQERLIKEGTAFLKDLLAEKREGSVLFLLGPYPAAEQGKKGQWLTPVICLGLGEGLLQSGTTRWPGLVTNMDLAPTILGLLGAEHSQPMIGREITVRPAAQAKETVEQVWRRCLALAASRPLVLKILVSSQIALYILALLFLIIKKVPGWAVRLLQILLVFFLALPLSLLLWAGPPWMILGWLALLSLVFGKLNTLWAKTLVIASATAAALLVDVFGGSRLLRFSYLGYDPIGGARFYGIGNEFMGILVGSTVMSWAIFCQNFEVMPPARKIGGLLLFSVVLLNIGAPAWGANVGGAVCAVFAFGFLWLALEGKLKKISGVCGLVFLLILVLSVFFWLDNANPAQEQSHLGQTVALFRRDGFLALKLIIQRKLAMNFRLLRYSIWSKALLVAVAVIAASFIWPSSFIRWLSENHPLIARGISGLVVGSLAAFLFNDSGVVAAATCLFFASTTLLLLALELKHNLTASQTHIKDNRHSH